MTRKDFELIAQILHQAKPPVTFPEECRDQWEDTTKIFANSLKAININFDKSKFLQTCEGKSKSQNPQEEPK